MTSEVYSSTQRVPITRTGLGEESAIYSQLEVVRQTCFMWPGAAPGTSEPSHPFSAPLGHFPSAERRNETVTQNQVAGHR